MTQDVAGRSHRKRAALFLLKEIRGELIAVAITMSLALFAPPPLTLKDAIKAYFPLLLALVYLALGSWCAAKTLWMKRSMGEPI